MSEHISDELADASLRDGAGAPHTLREYFAPRPAVLVWVRHFG